MKLLERDFYLRNSLVVAPDLLGKVLVRKLGNNLLSGRIIEVEAYMAELDEASHSYRGRTKRNGSLFISGGHAYIYSIHTHNCLDVVTSLENVPTSVLIRGLAPLKGIELMKKYRNKSEIKDLTSGPGKLTQALKIDKSFDGLDLTTEESSLYIASDDFHVKNMYTTPRIGISKATDKLWRFVLS